MHNLFAIVCVAFDHGAPPEKLATFKKCFFSCPVVDSAMEVTSSYDLIVRGHCASVEEYHRSFGTLRPPIAELVARFETNSVSLEVLRDASATSERHLWVPCEGGLKRVDANLIDKIVAEGDYMRVQVGT